MMAGELMEKLESLAPDEEVYVLEEFRATEPVCAVTLERIDGLWTLVGQ